MSDKRESIVERVRAMLAKAASTEHEAERVAFEEKAESLIVKWEIEGRELADIQPIKQHTYRVKGWGRATGGVVNTVGILANALHQGASGVSTWQGWNGIEGRVTIFCTDDQYELLEARLDHLLPQLMADINRDKPRSRKSYAYSWGYRVKDRLVAAQEVTYSESNALVPTNTEANRVMNETLNLGTGRRFDMDFGSSMAGAQAAASADLGQGRLRG